jgi:hypothetical protein
MNTYITRFRLPILFLLGTATGFGVGEALRRFGHRGQADRQPIAAPPSPATPNTDPIVEAQQLANARDQLRDRILARLKQPISDSDKAAHVRALGKLGTPKAVDYLLAHHDFTIIPEGATTTAVPPPAEYPCLDALGDIGIAAVPQAVEAYITLPESRWPKGLLHYFLLHHDRRRARVAYIYAQGYLFATGKNDIEREAVLELVRQAGGLVAHEGLPYPPPWMPPTEK